MSKSVWEFPIESIDRQVLMLPRGAKILTAQMRRGNICLYALCDNAEITSETRTFIIHSTGYPLPKTVYDSSLHYINTVQLPDRELIFHVFELLPETGVRFVKDE